MRSQAYLGERGRALRHYEELAQLLGEELGSSRPPKQARSTNTCEPAKRFNWITRRFRLV